MNQQDKPQFVETLTEFASYYNRKLPNIALRAWWNTCKALDIESFMLAIEAAIACCQQMPSPNELLQIAGGDQHESDWHTICREIGKTRLSDMNISHTSLDAALAIGGYNRLAYMKESEEPWVKKAFLLECKAPKKKPAAIMPGDTGEPALVAIPEELQQKLNAYTRGF
jgi:hypothetical protein